MNKLHSKLTSEINYTTDSRGRPYKVKHVECKECYKTFYTNRGATKYCKECAVVVNRRRAKERYYDN
jgi:ribosomal protein L37E